MRGVVFILFLSTAGSVASGQEDDWTEENGGWLGKRFIHASGGYSWPSDGANSKWASHVTRHDQHGAGIRLNLPAPWTDDLFTTLSHDLFASGHWKSRSETRRIEGDNIGNLFGASVREQTDLNSTIRRDQLFDTTTVVNTNSNTFVDKTEAEVSSLQFDIGTTVYVSTLRGVRPFVQLGYRYRRVEAPVLILSFLSNPTDGIVPTSGYRNFTKNEHRLLTIAGIEGDITDTLVCRFQFDANTRTGLGDSTWSAELIFWPTEHWFLNAGGFENLGNHFSGIRFGTGFSF